LGYPLSIWNFLHNHLNVYNLVCYIHTHPITVVLYYRMIMVLVVYTLLHYLAPVSVHSSLSVMATQLIVLMIRDGHHCSMLISTQKENVSSPSWSLNLTRYCSYFCACTSVLFPFYGIQLLVLGKLLERNYDVESEAKQMAYLVSVCICVCVHLCRHAWCMHLLIFSPSSKCRKY